MGHFMIPAIFGNVHHRNEKQHPHKGVAALLPCGNILIDEGHQWDISRDRWPRKPKMHRSTDQLKWYFEF